MTDPDAESAESDTGPRECPDCGSDVWKTIGKDGQMRVDEDGNKVGWMTNECHCGYTQVVRITPNGSEVVDV